MITLKEIAEICNVSVATVSNVLNGKSKASAETAEYILQVVKETGYRPNYIAKSLRTKKSRIIAVIVDDIAQFTSPPMVESIMEYCEKKGYRVVMRNLRLYSRWADSWHEQQTNFYKMIKPVLNDVLAINVDGVIYVAGHAREINCFEKDFPVPAVMAYAFSGRAEIPSIVIEDAVSAQIMTEYLIAQGHRKIGFIGGRTDNHHTQQRLFGYQKALYLNNILCDPDLIHYGEWERKNGYEGAKELLPKGVTALFCAADEMAGGAYDYLEEIGVEVGKEISVAGFNDAEMAAYFSPKLTTMRLPLAEIGHKAAVLLLDRLEREGMWQESQTETEKSEIYRIPCTLIERKSVGCRQKQEAETDF